jgi:ethanolamine utilization protein EutN
MWAAAKHPAFAGRTLMIVQPLDEHGRDAGTSFVAIDHVQAGQGDNVIVLTEGNGVRQILNQGAQVPIRSIIVGVVDHVDAPGAAAAANGTP